MAYAKVDDLYDDKRKIRRAWRAHPPNPIGLHIMAITYCQRHRLDGRVPDDWLHEMLPKAGERTRIIRTMVAEGLFEERDHMDGSYCIHDFLDWNESAADRKARSDASRRAANTRHRDADGSAFRIA
jgi:hypothetical protein